VGKGDKGKNAVFQNLLGSHIALGDSCKYVCYTRQKGKHPEGNLHPLRETFRPSEGKGFPGKERRFLPMVLKGGGRMKWDGGGYGEFFLAMAGRRH